MRILLTMNLPYFPVTGGADKANRYLFEELARRGHEVLVVVPSTAVPPRFTPDELVARIASEGLSCVRKDGHLSFTLDGVSVRAVEDRSLLRSSLLESLKSFDPEVVVVSSEDPSQVLMLAAMSSEPGRVVSLLHTLSLLPFGPHSFFPSPERAQLFRQLGAIVGVSKYVASYVERWIGVRASVAYMNSYGSGSFPRLGRFGAPFVTMVNPSTIKGLPIFMELARRFPEVKFSAIRGWATTAGDLKAMAALKNVTVREPNANIERVLADTAVLLAPSLWQEGFCMIVMDALLRGIPVLSSAVGAILEAMQGTEGSLPVNPIERYTAELDSNYIPIPVVPPQDIGPWCAALSELLTHEEIYRQRSDAAYAAAARFVSSLSVEPFERVLLDVAARRAERRRTSAPVPLPEPRESKPAASTLRGSLADMTPDQVALLFQKASSRAKQRSGSAPAAGASSGPLVTLQERGGKTPFFCVHAILGDALCYLQLARHVGSDRPFYGLQAPVFGGGDPLDSIQRMAERYVAAIQRIQDTGPYLLGGWSMGGYVAFEMARRLRAMGHEVALVALIDSMAPQVEREESCQLWGVSADWLGNRLEDATVLWAALQSLASYSGRPIALPKAQFEDLSEPEQHRFLCEQLEVLHPGIADLAAQVRGEPAALTRLLNVLSAHMRALWRFQPEPSAGRLTLIKTPAKEGTARAVDPTWGWQAVSLDPVIIREIPGNHFSIMTEPDVSLTASTLRACIAEALTS